jgi:hypothetical protein
MKGPTIWKLNDLFQYLAKGENQAGILIAPHIVHWFPARPMELSSIGHRLRATWLVFTGRADAVEWPFQ